MLFSEQQRLLIESPLDRTVFAAGPAGSGKTTAGVNRLLHLLNARVPASSILVHVPHRALAIPYTQVLRQDGLAPGGQVTIATMGSIAVQMIELFWPLVASTSGFNPEQKPTFLSLETAQYVMSRLITPLIELEGYFETVTIDRNRLFSQIIDNLNKAAIVGFKADEIGQRLKDAWLGEAAQEHTFDQVQDAALRFRQYCIEQTLLDFSLQMDVFKNAVWTNPTCREYLYNQHRHLIVENVEEDNPISHDVLHDWLQNCDSALVLYDTEAGFRRFLGADPLSALELRDGCDETVELRESLVTSPDMQALANELGRVMQQPADDDLEGDAKAALGYEDHRYYPEMLNWVAESITRLVKEEGTQPGEIVVVAPFLSDALRFSLLNRLNDAGIAARSHRPSRALNEEPATRCMLTLAQIAHPEWQMRPTPFDLAYALMQSIGSVEPGKTMDLVRAQLLAQAIYPTKDTASGLKPFDSLPVETQERVTYILGERYDALRGWLDSYIVERAMATPEPPKRSRKKKKQEEAPAIPQVELDHFFSRLFGEVLSQRGFGFFNNFEAADVAANLIDSARNFRRTIGEKGLISAGKAIGQEYIEMVNGGVIADQYVRQWHLPADNSVLLAPAYTFLMNNQPVSYQFWLDIGSRGWFERLYQPLTHPYVLSRSWETGKKWTDEHEYQTRMDTMHRITLGLLRRCRQRVYLGLSELSENGYDSQGELLQAVQRMLRRLSGKVETHV